MGPKLPRDARVRPVRRLVPVAGGRVGWIAGVSDEREPLVDFMENVAGPLPALSTFGSSRRELEDAARHRRPVVILFDAFDAARPIVLGFVVPPEAVDAGPNRADVDVAGCSRNGLRAVTSAPEVARVRGKHVVIEGKEEIVLRCGSATLTLDRNGRIGIRGAEILNEASGVNRVEGGSVELN